MDINEKYKKIRSNLQSGDIILFKSNSIIAKSIRWIDNAEFHHSGLVIVEFERVFILDAQPKIGTRIDFLSLRIKEKKYTDFCILRPYTTKHAIYNAICGVMDRAEMFVPYDYRKIAQIFMRRKFNNESLNKINKFDSDKDICSEVTQYYSFQLEFSSFLPSVINSIDFTPQDHLRYFKSDEFNLLYK